VVPPLVLNLIALWIIERLLGVRRPARSTLCVESQFSVAGL
jgi:hypothetical protein